LATTLRFLSPKTTERPCVPLSMPRYPSTATILVSTMPARLWFSATTKRSCWRWPCYVWPIIFHHGGRRRKIAKTIYRHDAFRIGPSVPRPGGHSNNAQKPTRATRETVRPQDLFQQDKTSTTLKCRRASGKVAAATSSYHSLSTMTGPTAAALLVLAISLASTVADAAAAFVMDGADGNNNGRPRRRFGGHSAAGHSPFRTLSATPQGRRPFALSASASSSPRRAGPGRGRPESRNWRRACRLAPLRTDPAGAST